MKTDIQPGLEFGLVFARITYELMHFARRSGLGQVALGPAVRVSDSLVPDAAFIGQSKIERLTDLEPPYLASIDLAVEIIRPGVAWEAMEARAFEYLAAGVPLLWLVDPYGQAVHVYPQGEDPVIYSCDEALPGGKELPGFSIQVQTLFD